jgi:hypothetical protein
MPHSTDGFIVIPDAKNPAAAQNFGCEESGNSLKFRMPHSRDGFIVPRVGRENAGKRPVLIYLSE